MQRYRPSSPFFPYTTLFRSTNGRHIGRNCPSGVHPVALLVLLPRPTRAGVVAPHLGGVALHRRPLGLVAAEDRKSTRLNSSHLGISYAVFCLKKKINTNTMF